MDCLYKDGESRIVKEVKEITRDGRVRKESYFTIQSHDDMTFLMVDVYEDNVPVSRECLGWNYGVEHYAISDFALGNMKAGLCD